MAKTIKKIRTLTKNQIVVSFTDGSEVFNSYGKNIVEYTGKGTIYFDTKYWDFSNTTSKWRNKFMGVDSKWVKDAIKNKIIKFKNLNE